MVTATATTETLTGAATTHTGSSYAYAWFSGAVEATELYDSDTTDSGNGLYTSTLVRDAREDLIHADIHDGVMRSVRYQGTVDGLVTQRDTVGAGAPPHARYWYFGGMQMGDVSNDGTSNVDYVTAIARHRAIPGSGFFTNGATAGVHVGDFDQSYDPINGLSYESAPSSLTVRDGDTLSSIAQEVWGDASFWYLIAQANGLDSTSELTAGQVLSIPNRVANAHNNSDTYSVYDPNEHIGNISPTHPPRPENHGCGAFGQILMLLVAVVVAAVLPGIGDFVAGGLVGMGVGPVTAGIIGGAISSAVVAAIGDAAGQAVGLAVGAIKSFNWNEVGMTALSAFIGGPPSGMSLPGAIVVGALGNAITQGIAVATGLQKSFDWGGVAAAGISAGVIHEVTGALSTTVDGQTVPGDLGLGSYNGAAVHAIGGMAGAIANAATRSLVNGSDFGDNIVKALPTVIAQTIGEGLLTAIADSRQHDPQPDMMSSQNPDGIDAHYTPHAPDGLGLLKTARYFLETDTSWDSTSGILAPISALGDYDPTRLDGGSESYIDPNAVLMLDPDEIETVVVTAQRSDGLGKNGSSSDFWSLFESMALAQANGYAGAGQTVRENTYAAARYMATPVLDKNGYPMQTVMFSKTGDIIKDPNSPNGFLMQPVTRGSLIGAGLTMVTAGIPIASMVTRGTTVAAEVPMLETPIVATEEPELFSNLFPKDIVGPPIQAFKPEQLLNMAGRRLNYVVTEDGQLVIGRQVQEIGGGHIDLAGGQPVRAAGEVKVVGGDIVYVDNSSGHYLPSGPSAQNAALNAFRADGFDVPNSIYIEKTWDPVFGWIAK